MCKAENGEGGATSTAGGSVSDELGDASSAQIGDEEKSVLTYAGDEEEEKEPPHHWVRK